MDLDRTTRLAILLLATITVLVSLKVAEAVFAPVTLALVIGVVLSPLTRLWERLRLPSALAALLTMAFGFGALALLAVGLEPVVWRVVDRAPYILSELRSAAQSFQEAVGGLNQMSEQVKDAVAGSGENAVSGADAAAIGAPGLAEAQATEDTAAKPAEPVDDVIEMPGVTDALWIAPALAGQMMIFAGTLFFFLLGRGEVYRWLSRHVDTDGDVDRGTEALIRAERRVSRYFLTIAAINTAFGAAVSIGLILIGMPSPIVWGVLAALMNFILYLGPAIMAGCLLLAGTVVFDGAAVLGPMVIYVGLNLIEGQFVTPALVGARMRVNPLMVFLSIVFWLWFWGPLGGIVAIPLVIWTLAVTRDWGSEQSDTQTTAELQTLSGGMPGTGIPNSSAEATE